MTHSSALAQIPQVGSAELAQARAALDAARAQLSAEHFELLSRKLAAAETASAELTTAARASQVAEKGAATAGRRAATATVGRALVSGAAEVLPFILLVWPATAHAPGVKEETPQVQAAKKKADEALEDLAQATRQIEAEQEAAVARKPKPTPAPKPNEPKACPPYCPPPIEREPDQSAGPGRRPREKPREDPDGCVCICGPPRAQLSERERVGRYREWRCRSICVEDYGFKYNEYVCL